MFSIIPLGTISIIFPYSKWFGANPVTLCLVLLYSSTLSSAIFVQFLLFLSEFILHLILFTNVWFTLSLSPVEDGQSVEVKINLMFLFLAYSWISLDVITGYRSARKIFMESVSPVESISFMISSERCVFDVEIKTALEKWSMSMCMYFFGELLLGEIDLGNSVLHKSHKVVSWAVALAFCPILCYSLVFFFPLSDIAPRIWLSHLLIVLFLYRFYLECVWVIQ